MDIAFWIEPQMLAGEGAFLRHLATALKAEGQQITFIVPHGLSVAELPVLGSRVLSYRWNRWERLGMIQRLRLSALAEALNDSPPDALVAWGSADSGGGGALAPLAAMVPNLPLVLWCWDASELFTPLARLPNLRHIIASSNAIAARLAQAKSDHAPSSDGSPRGEAERDPDRVTPPEREPQKSPPPPTPVTVVHPGVFCEETVACFDVEGQMPCLVSLDPLSSRVSYEALLRACRRLVDRGLEFLLFAYDKGSAEFPIWRMAEQMQLLERMSFVPFQQDAEPLLLHGDLYIHILPSGRVQYRSLEAMGRGLTIVTCPNPGVDYLIDGQTCRLVNSQTPEAWAAVLEDLLRDRAKAVAIARRGQQHMRDHHSMGRTLEQLTSICRQVAGIPMPIGGS